MRSTTTSYPVGSPCTTLSIRTNSACTSPPPFSLVRCTKAGGKLPSIPKRMPTFFIGLLGWDGERSASNLAQIIRQHVAPVVPVVAAPFPVVEPMLDSFGIQNAGEAQAFVAGIIPLAGAEDDAHVIELPRVTDVRQVVVGAVEVDVVVVGAVEEIADVERSAQADDMADEIGMAKGD